MGPTLLYDCEFLVPELDETGERVASTEGVLHVALSLTSLPRFDREEMATSTQQSADPITIRHVNTYRSHT